MTSKCQSQYALSFLAQKLWCYTVQNCSFCLLEKIKDASLLQCKFSWKTYVQFLQVPDSNRCQVLLISASELVTCMYCVCCTRYLACCFWVCQDSVESWFLPGAFLPKVAMVSVGFGSPHLPHWFLDTLKADFLHCFLIFVGEIIVKPTYCIVFLLVNILVWGSVSLISPVEANGAKLNSTCIFDFASEKIHTGIFFFDIMFYISQMMSFLGSLFSTRSHAVVTYIEDCIFLFVCFWTIPCCTGVSKPHLLLGLKIFWFMNRWRYRENSSPGAIMEIPISFPLPHPLFSTSLSIDYIHPFGYPKLHSFIINRR